MKNVLLKHSGFLFIFCLCAALRLFPLFDYQLTYDELSGLERTQFNSFWELIEKGVKIDAHPAFVQLLIFCTVKLFGYQTWIIKLPFLLMSLGALVYGYALGLRNFSKQAGLLMAVFLSFSLVFVFYAPIARMYISGVFFSLGLLHYFFELVFVRNIRVRNYFLFGFFAFMSGLNHHMNALFALSVYFSGLFFLRKHDYKAYLITGLLVVAAYLPNLSVSLYQLGVGGIGRDQGGWLDKPHLCEVFGFIKILLGTGFIYIVVIALILVSIIGAKKYSLTRQQAFLLLVFAFNYLVIYIYSLYRAAIYQHSVMMFSGMAFLLLISSLLDIKQRSLALASLLVIASLLLHRTYLTKNYFSEAVKTVYEYQFERTVHYKKKFGAESVYPVFFDADDIMKRICFKKYGMEFDCKISADSVTTSMKQFSSFVSQLKCDHLVLTSSMPAMQAVARLYFPYVLESTVTQGIHFLLLSKKPDDNIKETTADEELAYCDIEKSGVFGFSKQLSTSTGLTIDSLNEYPFNVRTAYSKFVKEEGNMVLLSTRLKFQHGTNERLEACIGVKDTLTNEHYGYASRSASEFVAGKDSTVMICTDYFAGTTFKKAKRNSELVCYFWNRGKGNAKLLSFNISLIDYWHQKWHFWD